MLING